MATLDRQKIGFIGLGLMGKGMARNLKAHGAELFVANRSQEAVRDLETEGMHACSRPADVAARVGAGIVVLSLTNTAAVDTVLFGSGGLSDSIAPGLLIVDMGTTSVEATRRFADRLSGSGAHFVDAPVSGGQVASERGTLVIMAGGAPEDIDRARPLFEAVGKTITHVGPVGAGQVAKVANQMIVALTIDAVASALALAKAAGVEPSMVREAIGGGFAQSRVLDLHGLRMIDGNFAPGGRATTQRKDVRQALDLAGALGLDLPALKLNLALWDRMVARGDGDLDHSGIIRIYEKSGAAEDGGATARP
ncbi:NAD(P)-dependent oxidoreductase [Corticibacterium sp. UT-5YL-CI-8]|nr:NAD(P)-dependent oxidoreductase [Tianweitania sp. UT-5YL-CI-8]